LLGYPALLCYFLIVAPELWPSGVFLGGLFKLEHKVRDSFIARRVIWTALTYSLFILASSFLISCSTIKQSAFHGRVEGSTSASTWIEMGSSDPSIRVLGLIEVEKGSLRLLVTQPDGRIFLDETYSRDPTSLETLKIEIDSNAKALPGIWLLELSGKDETSSGVYDLELSNR
jgi:hypothetical protein